MKANWDERFMALAEHIATWSKDPSTQVGTVIADEHGRVIGHGYNGFPRGVEDHEWRYEDRSVKYKMIVHAEVNAILNATRDPRGCVMYTTFSPCPQCTAMLIQAGIAIVYVKSNPSAERWSEDHVMAADMMREAGVMRITLYPPTAPGEDEEIPF